MESETYYGILGISRDATADEIKKAFRELARRYHPDKHPDLSTVDIFQKISEAYNTLSDPQSRVNYDLKIGLEQDSDNSGQSDNGEAQPTEQRRERKLSKVNIKALHKMVRDGLDGPEEERRASASTAKMRQRRQQSSSVNRLGVQKNSIEKVGDYFKKMLRKVEKTAASAAPVDTPKAAESTPQPRSEGGRIFAFTIDALESVIGTIREAAFEEAGEPRVVKVKIPAGVHDDAVINATSLTDDPTEVEVVRARIRIRPHKYVERDGYDITVKVPISVGEAISGVELEVPTPTGPAKFNLPPRWNVEQKYRLKGLGLAHPEKKFRGDLYVQPIVTPPNHTTQALDEAAKMIDSFYFSGVRSTFPMNLFSSKRPG